MTPQVPGGGPSEPVPVPEGMECAELEVPVDYDEPGGRTILLAVARLPGTGTQEEPGSVIYHAGGPAVPGIPEVAMAPERVDRLRESADLVTLNARGSVGGLQDLYPAEDCFLDGPRFTTPRSKAEYEEDTAAAEERLEACRRHDPDVFANLDSATRAHDVDVLRAALGEEDVNFFGQSYGAVAGASYARLHPDRVRTMYLDSPVSHVLSLEEQSEKIMEGTENAFERFAEWCAEDTGCVWHGQDVPGEWQALVDQADEEPIPAEEYDAEPYNGDDLKMAGAVLANYQQGWPDLSDAVERALDGDASGFMVLTGGEPAFMGAVSAATQCADGTRFSDYGEYRDALEEEVAAFPNFGGARAGYDMMCSAWPRPEANPPGPIDSDGLPPILAASSTHELYEASSVAGQIPESVALELEGMDHGLYFGLGNSCVMEHADRYLANGTLPEQGTTCELD